MVGIPFDAVCAIALAILAAGCDSVLGLKMFGPGPDAPSNDLGCATRGALLCADFEQGNTFYANGVLSDVPMPVGNVTASVEEPGADGGHALYVDSAGATYRLETLSTTAATRITATFDVELARFDANTPATSLVVLYFEQTQVAQCYVAVVYKPTPPRLTLVENCTSQEAPDLVTPLPSHTLFVPVTFTMDLVTKSGSAQLGANSATVPIDPGGATMTFPGVIFGFVDPLGSSAARVGFDNLLVVTAP
jgi:hypothetical protein